MRKTLADVCGISPQAVRDWESGSTQNIRHEHLVAIARHFGVSTDYLLTGDAGAEVSPELAQRWARLSEDQKAMFLRMIDAAATDPEGR